MREEREQKVFKGDFGAAVLESDSSRSLIIAAALRPKLVPFACISRIQQ